MERRPRVYQALLGVLMLVGSHPRERVPPPDDEAHTVPLVDLQSLDLALHPYPHASHLLALVFALGLSACGEEPLELSGDTSVLSRSH
jgi:hypothetical protein